MHYWQVRVVDANLERLLFPAAQGFQYFLVRGVIQNLHLLEAVIIPRNLGDPLHVECVVSWFRKARIVVPVAAERTIILRPGFVDAKFLDPLKLRKRVTDRLRETSLALPEAEKRGSAPGFVVADEMPGAVSVGGGYTVDTATVTMTLSRDGTEFATRTVIGKASEPDKLADEVTKTILAALPAR